MSPAVQTGKTLQEKALVNIAERDDTGSEVFNQDFEAEIEDPSFPTGSRDWSMTQLTSGGQERLYDPEEEKTFSATMYIKGVDASTASGIEELFHTGEVSGGTATKDITSSLERKDLRIVFMSTTASASSATDSVGTDETAYRMIMQNAEVISAETNFEDNVLTVEFEAKANAFTPAGVGNVRKQSAQSSDSNELGSIPSYDDSFDIEDGTFGTV